jgi:HK97 family phage prohead protease
MSEMISRAFTGDLEIRADATGRTVHGIVVPFDRVARVSDGGPFYDEAFQRGAFAKTISERGDRVKLLGHHDRRSNPLGKATMLREDAAGLYGEFLISRTTAGDEVLELVRDGALDAFSAGFSAIKHVMRDRVMWRTEVGLREASLVTFGAYPDALVGGVRSLSDLSEEDVAALARMVAEHIDLRSTTPDGESETTAAEAADPDSEPGNPLRSATHNHHRLRAQARKEGGPLS